MRKAFMIAATGSGCGKTLLTCGLLGALKMSGKTVNAFKCGPDYIDPMFHRDVIGIPSENLDLFLGGTDTVRRIFLQSGAAEVSVVEGVMGLYDGQSPVSVEGSSYEVACVLDLPIILTVDAKGMGRSILAVIRGFLEMDTEHRIKAVFLNRISKAYYETIKPIIEQELSIAVIGYLPVKKEGVIESRHLGLKTPEEIENLKEIEETLSKELLSNVDFETLLSLSKTVEEGADTFDVQKCGAVQSTVRIAVARDEAFCFYYEENFRQLEAAGAKLVFFSPLHDSELPKEIDGILLGGGYPELYAKELSENRSMLQEIRSALTEQNLPSLAECGGFLYLHETMWTKDMEQSYPMTGVLKGSCRFEGKLVRFGYVEIQEQCPVFLVGKNPAVRGHEFHYYDTEMNGNDCISTKPVTGKHWESSVVKKNSWWGFAHVYYASNPEFAKHFVDCCRHDQKERRG